MSFTAVLKADIEDFKKKLDEASKKLDGLEKEIDKKTKSIGESFTNLGKKTAVLSVALTGIGVAAFNMASDFEDALGATDQVFKESSEEIKNWAKNLNSQYGIAKKEALEYSNLMGTMLINIGNLSREEAAKTSSNLVQLAGDLTAMYGGKVSEAVNALTASLRGNNIMLNKYGVAINDIMIKSKALEMGLIAQGQEMSLQAKQTATLALIYEQTSAAQGQASREAESASGVIRALGTEIKNLTTSLGESLLPIITPVLAKLRDFAAFFAQLPDKMKTAIAALGVVGAAFSPLMLAIGKMITLMPVLKTGFIAFKSAIGGITLPLLAAGAAITLIIQNWDKIKEYFTKGAGAETFEKIKNIAIDLRAKLQETFEKIREFVTIIWDKFGTQLKSIWESTFLQIKTVIDTFIKIIGNVADILNGIFTGNWKLALSGLSDLFTNIFRGIYNIVMGAIARMASGISGFLKFVGLEKLSTSLQNFSQNLNERIAENIAVSEKQKETVEATEKATKKLTDTTNELTVATQVGTQAIVERVAAMEALTGKTFEGTITTELDAGLEIDDLERRISERLESLKEKAAEFTLDVGGMIQDSVTSLMEGIGTAIGDGTSVIDAIGAALLGTLGGLAVQIGQQMIAFGTAGMALQKLTLNPLLAIAAGAALVALGSAAKSAISRSMSGAGTGGYSGGISGTYSDRQSLGASTLRGAYQDDFLVEFKIGNDALVGTLNTAEQRKNRTI